LGPRGFTCLPLAYGGNVNADGYYVVGDIDVHVGHTPIWATLTGLYGQTDAVVRRGYDNAGSLDSSRGTQPQQTLAVCIRGEARLVWHKGPVAVTPYTDFAVIGTRTGSYSEAGGGFPAAFNGHNDTAYDLRYGAIVNYDVTERTRLVGDLGGVHRFDGKTSGVSGDMIGLFNFSLPGASLSHDWARVSAGIDQKIGPGVFYANVTAASRGEDPTYMLAAGHRAA
jgi:uncharacterized protein with beta-barrel porin domain